ncbi:PREDICTED: pectinesterase 3-like [Nelumbo nucifera]|uniref:pectinesterase n=1 Tax=Nelumbo nucifera TaxID=4432 RepID=A0A1U8AGX1_NELNU|nr:PREDICTED: pectinesterase 3-like [Nelumbo nucifera]
MMDTIKSFKGYGKIDEPEEREFRRETRKRLIIIAVSAFILVIIIVAFVVGSTTHKDEKNDSDKSMSIPSTISVGDSIKTVCNVTLYPKSCISSISSLKLEQKTTDPEEIFKLSLQVAFNELSNLSSLPQKLIAKVNNDPALVAALQDCQIQFEEAVDQINSSISSMQVGQREKLLTDSKITNLRTWLSSAITYEQTCLDGLEELNSSSSKAVLEEMKAAMRISMELTSNSLAIVSKMQTLLDKFNTPIHRKLLGLVAVAVVDS